MTDTAIPAAAPTGRRIIAAGGIYFAIVFGAGLLLGPPRVMWLEPWLGQTLAVAVEAPILLFAMSLAARAAPRWAGLRGGWMTFLAVGFIAFLLQQIADLAVGFGLRGMTLGEQWAYFATPPGSIYAACLALFVLMPLLRRTKDMGVDA